MANNIVFLEQWKNELMNDEFAPLTEEEIAYMVYAAAIYCWTGEKTDFQVAFNRPDLTRVMAPYYAQIDNICNYKDNMKKVVDGKQNFDNDAIKELAAQGISQKEICRRLGYDEARSRSLSSNRGYREGRALFLAGVELESQSESKKKSELTQNELEIVSSESESKNESELTDSDKTDKLSGTFNF